MDKLASIKIRQDNGTYSNPIPVSVLAENVECNNGNYLIDILGNIDIQEKGNIQYQLNQLFNTKISVSELNKYVYNILEQTITGWLDSNIEPFEGAVDSSLSIEGAAADAKVTGDIKKIVTNLQNIIFTHNWTIGGLRGDFKGITSTTSRARIAGAYMNVIPGNYNVFLYIPEEYQMRVVCYSKKGQWSSLVTEITSGFESGYIQIPSQYFNLYMTGNLRHRIDPDLAFSEEEITNLNEIIYFSLSTPVGLLKNLNTNSKKTIVSAINELNNQTIITNTSVNKIENDFLKNSFVINNNWENIPWVIGQGLNPSNGTTVSNRPAFIRSACFLKCLKNSSINVKDGFLFQICEYSAPNVSSFIKGRTASNTPYIVENDGYIRVAIKAETEEELTNFATAYDNFIPNIIIENKYNNYSFGYNRKYIDITDQLIYSNQKIENNNIINSNIDLLAQLPNIGNIEIRTNAPAGKFLIYKYSNGTYTLLNESFSHYCFRYTGDYISKYFIVFETQSETSISSEHDLNLIKIYRFEDQGEKNFNNIPFYNKKIACFGDSIVQGRYCKNSASVNTIMSKPYSVLLGEKCNDFNPKNYGIGGALVYNSDWKSLYLNCQKVKNNDIVFICAGTNDFGSNISREDFIQAYSYVIDKLITNNTEVIICTPTYRNRTSANSAGLTLADYADIEKDIAISKSLIFIDLYNLTKNFPNWSSYLPDGLHPNEIGHKIIAELLIDNYGIYTY